MGADDDENVELVSGVVVVVVVGVVVVVVVARTGVTVEAAAFPCKPISAAMTAAAAVEVAATAPVTRFTRRLPAVRTLMVVLSISMST